MPEALAILPTTHGDALDFCGGLSQRGPSLFQAEMLNADGSSHEMVTANGMTNHEEMVTDTLIVDGKRSHEMATADGADGMVTGETLTASERATPRRPGARVWEGLGLETPTSTTLVRSCDYVAASRAQL